MTRNAISKSSITPIHRNVDGGPIKGIRRNADPRSALKTPAGDPPHDSIFRIALPPALGRAFGHDTLSPSEGTGFLLISQDHH